MNNISKQLIIAQVAHDFPNFKPEVTFGEMLEKNIKNDIVAFKSDKKQCNVIIITEHLDTDSSMLSPKYVYSITRFFPLGNNWEVSYDLQQQNCIRVFELLLDVETDQLEQNLELVMPEVEKELKEYFLNNPIAGVKKFYLRIVNAGKKFLLEIHPTDPTYDEDYWSSTSTQNQINSIGCKYGFDSCRVPGQYLGK